MRRIRTVVTLGFVCLPLFAPTPSRADEDGPVHHVGQAIANLPARLNHPRPVLIIHPAFVRDFGYIPTCWTPWPSPAADWSHCRCAPTSVLPPITSFGSPPPAPEKKPVPKKIDPSTILPPPRKLPPGEQQTPAEKPGQ
jgi:hypothetical protein